ncbi:hypothetical protein D3227_17990 [Mesorhizobium waimense]|uniref:Uncharacterized protein n=1 Tax=Mesorhizobium waimense TaxID=1300307 RepID=A0A3A5KNH6_9HYPH|nr:hypothetical protein D3227_17990 [Mesorhizobium waimense]
MICGAVDWPRRGASGEAVARRLITPAKTMRQGFANGIRAGRKTGNPLLLIAGLLLAGDRTQNRKPLLLIAGLLLAGDRTQNRKPLLLIARGC